MKNGKIAGQRFAAELRLLADDEQAAVEPKQPKLSAVAGMLCRDEQFWQWANERSFDTVDSEDAARAYICTGANVGSRAELDHKAEAADWFVKHVVLPFNEYRHMVNTAI